MADLEIINPQTAIQFSVFSYLGGGGFALWSRIGLKHNVIESSVANCSMRRAEHVYQRSKCDSEG